MTPAADPRDFPADASSRLQVPRQPWAPPAPANGQPEGRREDIPPPIRGIAGPGPAQDLHHVDVPVAYQGIDYRPQPFGNPAYVFPDAGHVQGAPIQGQPGPPVNQDHFGYFPQHVALGPPQDAFPHPFIRIPTPNQPRAEDLRRLAIRYLEHPGAQVRMVCTEEGIAGGFKTVIVLETLNIP